MGKVLSCKECGMQWGSKRPETWTDDEIANKFWCEVPPENTVYVMKESDSGFTYLAPAPEKKTEPVEAAKAPSDPLLQKMLKAVGKY